MRAWASAMVAPDADVGVAAVVRRLVGSEAESAVWGPRRAPGALRSIGVGEGGGRRRETATRASGLAPVNEAIT